MDDQFKEYLKDAIDEIRGDRKLADLMYAWLKEETEKCSGQSHDIKNIGQVASKFLEARQRSSEQVIKILNILGKSQSANSDLTEEEINNLHRSIEEEVEFD